MKQQMYAQDLLLCFDMLESKLKATPLISKLDLSKKINITEDDEVSKHEYQSLIGSLIYLVITTRPDLAYSVSYLSKFNQNPKKRH